jgi:uncharacterized protein YkvS
MLETNIVSIEANVSSIEANVSSIEANVVSIEANVVSIEFELGNLDSLFTPANVDNLTEYLSNLEDTSMNLRGNVEMLETNVSSIEANVSSIEANVSYIEANVLSIEANVVSIEFELGNLDSLFTPAFVGNLTEYLSNFRGDVEMLETNVSSIEANVLSIEFELGNLDTLFTLANAGNLTEYLSNFRGNVETLETNVSSIEATLPTIATNLQIVFSNVEAALHSAQYKIHTINQRVDFLEGSNVFEPVFTMVSTNDATIVFRNLQKGTSVRVIITPSADNDTIIHETNVHLDTLRVVGLEPSTAYTANIGSPDYFTVIEFTTPSSSNFSLTFVGGNVTMQGLLSVDPSIHRSLRVYVKDQSRITVYSSEIPGGYSGAVVTFDVSGNITTGDPYVFEVKDIVNDVLLANLDF